MKANWENRTLFHGDNLDFLREMNSESVDLIATDPPFNKNRDFHATPDSLAKGASFQDRWSWERDVHEDWVDQIKDDHPGLMTAIESARGAHSDGMGAFMCFLSVRLLAMHRILKETGSVFLHCDDTASHYIKACMDAIFGAKNFRNEIIWCYRGMGAVANKFQRKNDRILFYAKSSKSTFNTLRSSPTPESVKTYESGKRVGYVANHKRKMVVVFDRKKYEEAVASGKIPSDMRETEFTGGQPRMADWWSDIKILGGPGNKERTGYPTQKPLALYERIILAASNPGDIVLDPFAGCATTCVAAERKQRQWVGMDIWDKVAEVIKERMARECHRLLDENFQLTTEKPVRTDDGQNPAPHLRVPRKKMQAETGPKMSRAEMMAKLIEDQGLMCQGCFREFEHESYLQLDHMLPRADGGANHIDNRTLLCGPCNMRKSHRLTLSGLRAENKKVGFMAK